MSHIDDGKLNALLDGELESADAVAVRAHIAGCTECAKRLDEAKRFLTEAADLLGALETPKPARVPEAQPRRVTKTAKEVAIDVDGATQQSPAIGADPPERLWRHGPRSQQERHGFDYTSLAWAATVVLAVGIGYLANEVRHAREGIASGEAIAARGTPPASVPAGAPAADKTTPGSRARESRAGAVGGGRAASSSGLHGAPAAKPQPGARGSQLAARPATGLDHRRLDAPPRTAAGAGAAPSRPTEIADAVQTVPKAAVAPAQTSGNAVEARRPEPATGLQGAGVLSAAGAGAPRGAVVALPASSQDAFHRASLEAAVARLQGSIRLIDGMRSDHVEIGSGRQVPGADSGRDVVRVVYGRARSELVLDQQRLPRSGSAAAEERAAKLPQAGMGPADTLLTTAPDGRRSLRWRERGGFWLSLTGRVPADSLKRLAARVR